MKYDPHKSGAQYLEDLATSYWYASALFTALDSGLFEVLRENNQLDAEAAAGILGWKPGPAERFLRLLKEMGLVDVYEGDWYLTGLTADHLVDGAPHDQRANIRWRRDLRAEWDTLPDVLAAGTRTLFPSDDVSEADMHARRVDYLKAMDAVIDGKIAEMLPMFTDALPALNIHFRFPREAMATSGSGFIAATFVPLSSGMPWLWRTTTFAVQMPLRSM